MSKNEQNQAVFIIEFGDGSLGTSRLSEPVLPHHAGTMLANLG